LSTRTEGTSGPIAWRVENIRVVTAEAEGKPYDAQAFTVVLKNVSERTVTFTNFDETKYRPGTKPGVTRSTGSWVLRPGSEWKINRTAGLVCRSGGGCMGGGATHQMVRIIVTGSDDQGRPVEAQLDITLPPADIGRTPIIR
jgi:hypothetical protein